MTPGQRGWHIVLTFAILLLPTVQAAGGPAPGTLNTEVGLPSLELNALSQLRSSLNLTIGQAESLRWAQSIPCLGNCSINQCFWDGIACSGGHVTQIDLSDDVVSATPNLLSGQLVPGLSQLSQLRYLNMSGHTFSGTLPGAWSNLTALQTLDLSNNALTGTLPPQWAGMTSLVNLNLSNNVLNGDIPASWTSLPALKTLDLQSNKLCADNVTFSNSTQVLETTSGNCTPAQILASQVPANSPALSATPLPTPAQTPANSSSFNQNNAPILQMSTGINIAVSVVIGAFLLFGIIAGIFRIKRQQRAHQRWITGRMLELRQREAREEANFRELMQKIVPPSIMLDPLGDEIWIAHPDRPVAMHAKQGEEVDGPEWETLGPGSTVSPAASLPDSTLSSSAHVNDHSSAPRVSTAAGGSETAEGTSRASSPTRADHWHGGSTQLPPLTEQYRYISDFHRRQRLGLRPKKVPLFTVDVFISERGSLTFDHTVTPPLDRVRPAVQLAETSVDSDSSPEVAGAGLPPRPPSPGRKSRDAKRSLEMTDMERRPSVSERFANRDFSQIEARRMEGIGRLREDTPGDSRRGDAPPAPLVGWPALRRLFGMETLEAREERLRSQAEQIARGEQVAGRSQSVTASPEAREASTGPT